MIMFGRKKTVNASLESKKLGLAWLAWLGWLGWLACVICVLRPQLLPVIGPAAVVVFLITYRVCRREICRDLPPIDPPSDRNATNSCLDGQHRCRAGYAASAVQKRNENIVSDANRPLLRLDKAGRRPSAGHSRERVPRQHLVTP